LGGALIPTGALRLRDFSSTMAHKGSISAVTELRTG
jgi:hypothetical protein